jgi:U3 small nucleolar RNA-associated protein 4
LAADEATSQTTVETLGVFPHGARLATFTPNGDTIILVTPDSEVQIHPFLDEEAPTIQFPYNGDRGSYINKIAVSPDAQTFASSSSSSLITIQSFNPNIPPQTLPQTSSAITSLSFLTPTVISVTLAERNRLLLFAQNGIDWNLHPWCQNVENMPLQIGITRDKCLGTFILNNDVSQVWLWGANWLAWIQPNNQKTQRKIDQPDKFTVALQANLDGSSVVKPDECPNWITYRYREVLLVDYLSSTPDKTELVIVERPRHEIMEDITEPRFYRHEYGT